MKNIAVIGAGCAGLAAAITLRQAGRPVTIYESARQPGGRARSVQIDGLTLDNGQHILLGAYHETLRLMEVVAPGSTQHALLRQALSVHQRGAFLLRLPEIPAPLNLVVGLLSAQGLRLADRIAALRFAARLRLAAFRTDARQTVAELLQSQPSDVVRNLWEPLCLAALNTPLHLASAQVFLNVLQAAFANGRSDSDLLLPRCDLGELFPQPAVAWLDRQGAKIRLGFPVRSLEASQSRWLITTPGERTEFDAVILAVSPQQLSVFAATIESLRDLAAKNEVTGYQPIRTIYWRFSPEARLPDPIMALDGSPGQWLLDRGQLCGTSGLMATVISAETDIRLAARPLLLGAAASQVERLFPELGKPAWSRLLTERRATYACRPNRAPPPMRAAPRLFLAGDYCYPHFPGTIEAAVRSGIAAARAALSGGA